MDKCFKLLAAQAPVVTGDDDAASSLPADLKLRLRAAAQHLTAQAGLRAGSSRAGDSLQNLHTLQQLMQPAADLAALIQQYYALPALAAERQLAVAQAAASRSCAYLRCANLGGEGGPAAGQGAGSMRCRWGGWGEGQGPGGLVQLA